MYYSGSRGTQKSAEHDLLKNYFTSSKTKDFKSRLRNNRTEFKFVVEYFTSREEAFIAEEAFHKKHDVAKNPYFYNATNASTLGLIKAVPAGTVLCLDKNGKSYRVSMQEYQTGNHKHISSGKTNVICPDGSMKKINVSDFDENIHRTQFTDYVMCIDTETGAKRRIPRELFNSNDKFVGITTGRTSVIDLRTGQKTLVPVHELQKDYYVGTTSGKTSVYNKETGVKITINSCDYNREKHEHFNIGKITVFSLSLKKNVRITLEEFNSKNTDYANTATSVFFEFGDKFFKSRKDLNEYYFSRTGRFLPRLKASELSTFDHNIRIITKHEYCKN